MLSYQRDHFPHPPREPWRVLRLLVLTLSLFTICFLLRSSSLRVWGQTDIGCSGDYYVNETLPNGSVWAFCWEHRYREGIAVRNVYFTPPGGQMRKVLYEGNISQIHVPYDDNGTRYHDVTDYGIGGSRLEELIQDDCPDGSLLSHQSKAVVCKRVNRRGHVYKSGSDGLQGHALAIFSVSKVGSYSYVPVWQFFDDGTINPMMGATGKLQRRGVSNAYGWPIRSNAISGISHIHNYYWRLDFELGEDRTNDIVEEIDLLPSNNGLERTVSVTRLITETARSIDPEKMRSWRIRDGELTNSHEQPISYELLPLKVGHRDVGPADEPWTHNDLYVTQVKACERFVSHNTISANCPEDIAGFVDGESLDDADVVLWFGVSFHHIPRDEDEVFMHTHWDGFQIVPRDWTSQNPFISTQTPTVTNTPTAAETPTATALPSSTTTLAPTQPSQTGTATATMAAIQTPAGTAVEMPTTSTTTTSLAPTPVIRSTETIPVRPPESHAETAPALYLPFIQ